MGTIAKFVPVSVQYAVYYDDADNIVLVEDLTDVNDRVVKEILPQDPGSIGVCSGSKKPTIIGGSWYCI